MFKSGHTFTNLEQGAGLTTPDMRVLCYMAVSSELFNTACDDYSEGEAVAIIRAQLELHRHAVDLILERLDSE